MNLASLRRVGLLDPPPSGYPPPCRSSPPCTTSPATRYDRPVALGPQVIRLRPAPHSRTRDAELFAEGHAGRAISSTGSRTRTATGWRGSSFPRRPTEFKIEVDLTAEMAVINPFDFFVEPYAETFPFAYPDDLRAELAAYLDAGAAGPAARGLRRGARREEHAAPSTSWSSSTRACSSEIGYRHPHGAGRADAGGDAGARDPAPAATRPGCWCRSLRQLGLAARFVSGYLIQLKADVDPLEGPQGTDNGFHATCTPGPRSISRAPAGSASTRPRACSAGEGHIPLAATPHYRSAAPITGAGRARRTSISTSRCASTASPRRRASPSRSPTTPGTQLDALGERGRRAISRRRTSG